MDRQQDAGQRDQPQQQPGQRARLLRRDAPLLDQARAAGEREQPVAVGRIRPVERIVVVVEHVGARVRGQRQHQRRRRQQRVEAAAAGGCQRHAEQAGHRRDGQEAGSGHGQ